MSCHFHRFSQKSLNYLAKPQSFYNKSRDISFYSLRAKTNNFNSVYKFLLNDHLIKLFEYKFSLFSINTVTKIILFFQKL